MICLPGSLFALGHLFKRFGLPISMAKQASEAALAWGISHQDHVAVPTETVRQCVELLKSGMVMSDAHLTVAAELRDLLPRD